MLKTYWEALNINKMLMKQNTNTISIQALEKINFTPAERQNDSKKLFVQHLNDFMSAIIHLSISKHIFVVYYFVR